jgi:aspartate-semialdehyde dehydrogenase
VGQVFLRIMEERNFPVDNLRKGAVLNAVRIAEEELNQDILAIRKVW